MNDAPKMVALILAAGAASGSDVAMQPVAFVVVALGMMAGSCVAGRRVTGVLAEKVARMDHHEGFVANLVTATMVGAGAALGLPMSTTHVSSGTIIGLGSQDAGRLDWKTVRSMLLAWVITLPAAAALGIATYEILRLLVPFRTYVFWSWLCMLPGTVLYVAGADALFTGFSRREVSWGSIAAIAVAGAVVTFLIRYARHRLNEGESPR